MAQYQDYKIFFVNFAVAKTSFHKVNAKITKILKKTKISTLFIKILLN
jgi:hypothetical protein